MTTTHLPAAITSVGRYKVVDRIGQGGMAEIYSAVTTGEGGFRRAVVIKRLRPTLTDDPIAVAQFSDEANLLAALHHPNIVAVQDFGRAGDQLFLAEEYVLGRDLGRLVKRSLSRDDRPPPLEVVAYVCHELLKGLDYAHGLRNEEGRPLGIVHRDVSPENIMVSSSGEVKLLDFGVGKSAEARASKSESGVIKGNVTFMSPEQARGLGTDARADLYALALVIYYCLAGKPLYDSDTTYGLILKAGAGPGQDEWAAVAELPEAIGPFLRRAWAPEIERRHQTAREMAAELEPMIGDGAKRTLALMTHLFGDDLAQEAKRMNAGGRDATADADGQPAG
jgi:serine/threonine-protein kinase